MLSTENTEPLLRRGPLHEVPLSWYERLLIWLLSLGPVPSHIGVIPDGNRRFARKSGLSVDQGHRAGSDKLGSVGTWANKMGVYESSIYVFSTHNFNRPKSEIDGIFGEMASLCRNILTNYSHYRSLGCRVRCVGDLEMLPRTMQRLLAKVDIVTSGNRGGKTMTMCIAYSSRHQMARMALKLAKAVKENTLQSADITTELIDEYVGIEDAPEIGMLVRTSGETRLSDYLLWQGSFANLHFEPKMLPDMSFWDYFKAALYYQVGWKSTVMTQRKLNIQGRKETVQDVGQFFRQRLFLRRVQADRNSYLARLAEGDL
ncbi:dehydrodolichyl diphosphate synthase complex subunit DHDDS-like [Ixodes scapularis]